MTHREPAALVERESELAALAAIASDAARGEGRLVVVEGPAGIGKTRLLRHARVAAAGEGARVFVGRGTELEAHAAFGVVRQLFEPLVFAAAEAERAELFAGAAALARAVLGAGDLRELDARGADRYSQINGLFWFVSSLAKTQPLVIVVDDVQWVDSPSAEFLGFLAHRIEGLPVLLAVATRPVAEAPGHISATLLTEPGATVLRPAPLSRGSVETLVRDAAGADADEDFALACLEATRGNPFLLSELLREVSARRLAPTAQTARRIGSLAPGGVSAAIELRLAGMPDGARPLAEAVAILGEGAGAGLAARLAGLDHGAMGAAEDALVRAGILEGDSGLNFTHPLVRTTVLAGMSASRRERHHAAAYALLVERGAHPEELATHALHMEPARDPQRVAILRAAAERARVLGAPATAAAYLRRALAEPPAPELRCEVLTELGHAEARAGLGDATEHLRIAVAEASAPTARARAALELARALKFGGDAVRAVDVLEAVTPDLVDPELRELVELELIGLAYISRGARERLAERIALLEDPGHAPRTRLEAFVLAGMAFDGGASGLRPAAETGALAVRSVAGDLMPVDAREGGYGMLIAGVAAMWADRLADANRINARMLDEARRRGSVILRVSAASMQALVSWRRGRIADADADSSLALELARDAHGAGALVPAARAVKALIALTRDSEPGELARLEAETLDRGSDPDALPFHLLLHARGLLRIAQGAHETGIEDLLECGRVSLAWGAANPTVVPWRSDAALALARAGASERAAQLAAEELELAERFGTQRAIGVAQRAVALVADDERTLPGLERAVATLTDSPALLELATATTDLAYAQRRAGQKTSARDTAALAQELAVRAGATALARRAREEALASGARPRRVARSGVASLTPSELRVAQRAAEGHSNREIGEDLFVTVKTVEMHLAKAYGKLGIRSRTELADALAETAMTA